MDASAVTAITSSVDFATIMQGVGVIATSIAVVMVARLAVKAYLLRAINSIK